MLPFGGQAANQAIEDGGALGVLLRGVTDEAQMMHRLHLFQNLKKGRTSVIQHLSSVRIGREKEVEIQLQKYTDPEYIRRCTGRRICCSDKADNHYKSLKTSMNGLTMHLGSSNICLRYRLTFTDFYDKL